MRFILHFFLLFVSWPLLTQSPAAAQPLWGGTEYGMSLEQVSALLPKAAPPQSPNRLNDGSQELLRLEGVEVVNRTFSAKFYFRSGSLSQVTLSLDEEKPFDSVLPVFDSVVLALRAKYGAEIERNIARGNLNRAKADWLSGRTNISVIVLSVGKKDALLNINYQVRLAREADKL